MGWKLISNENLSNESFPGTWANWRSRKVSHPFMVYRRVTSLAKLRFKTTTVPITTSPITFTLSNFTFSRSSLLGSSGSEGGKKKRGAKVFRPLTGGENRRSSEELSMEKSSSWNFSYDKTCIRHFPRLSAKVTAFLKGLFDLCASRTMPLGFLPNLQGAEVIRFS